MKDLEIMEARLKKENELKEYKGEDRVVPAQERREELEEIRKTIPKFKALSGIYSLDKTTDGFRRGQLIVVSGPPKNGKTAFCQTLTKKFVQESKVLWFSYENSYEDLFEKFNMPTLNFEVPRMLKSGRVDWIEEKIIESKVKYGCDVVFIDNLDFLRDPEVMGRENMNTASYVGGIVQKLKRMAVEHNCVVVLMAHIRKNKWTSSSLPSSEELRDSGQIAQLADTVLMVMRKRDDKKELYEGNKAMVGVIENRHNGKTGKIHLVFQNGMFEEDTVDFNKMEQIYGQSTIEGSEDKW